MNDLAIELSEIVHNECNDAKHDIGLRLLEVVEKHKDVEKEVFSHKELMLIEFALDRTRFQLKRCDMRVITTDETIDQLERLIKKMKRI